jgi:hypothetical protein
VGGAFFRTTRLRKMNKHYSRITLTIKFLVDANFYISALVLVYGGLTAVTDNYAIFEFNEDLFGSMHNNLRMALLYLGMTEVVICLYCFATNQPKMMLFVGYFLLMMMGSLAFYGKINTVPIDKSIPVFFLYTGLSHIVFGMLSGIENSHSTKIVDENLP